MWPTFFTLFIYIALGHVPRAWRMVQVVYLQKPGKDTYSSPSRKAVRLIGLKCLGLEYMPKYIHYSHHCPHPGNMPQCHICKHCIVGPT